MIVYGDQAIVAADRLVRVDLQAPADIGPLTVTEPPIDDRCALVIRCATARYDLGQIEPTDLWDHVTRARELSDAHILP